MALAIIERVIQLFLLTKKWRTKKGDQYCSTSLFSSMNHLRYPEPRNGHTNYNRVEPFEGAEDDGWYETNDEKYEVQEEAKAY